MIVRDKSSVRSSELKNSNELKSSGRSVSVCFSKGNPKKSSSRSLISEELPGSVGNIIEVKNDEPRKYFKNTELFRSTRESFLVKQSMKTNIESLLETVYDPCKNTRMLENGYIGIGTLVIPISAEAATAAGMSKRVKGLVQCISSKGRKIVTIKTVKNKTEYTLNLDNLKRVTKCVSCDGFVAEAADMEKEVKTLAFMEILICPTCDALDCSIRTKEEELQNLMSFKDSSDGCPLCKKLAVQREDLQTRLQVAKQDAKGFSADSMTVLETQSNETKRKNQILASAFKQKIMSHPDMMKMLQQAFQQKYTQNQEVAVVKETIRTSSTEYMQMLEFLETVPGHIAECKRILEASELLHNDLQFFAERYRRNPAPKRNVVKSVEKEEQPLTIELEKTKEKSSKKAIKKTKKEKKTSKKSKKFRQRTNTTK